MYRKTSARQDFAILADADSNVSIILLFPIGGGTCKCGPWTEICRNLELSHVNPLMQATRAEIKRLNGMTSRVDDSNERSSLNCYIASWARRCRNQAAMEERKIMVNSVDWSRVQSCYRTGKLRVGGQVAPDVPASICGGGRLRNNTLASTMNANALMPVVVVAGSFNDLKVDQTSRLWHYYFIRADY
jgi:hypothetical protein